MTPWTWWAGEPDCATYDLAEGPTREAVIKAASQGMAPGDQFWIIEARASTDKRHEGSDHVPFQRTRNKETITVGLPLPGGEDGLSRDLSSTVCGDANGSDPIQVKSCG